MMDQVNDDHEPLIITRAKGSPAVLISLDDYTAMDETAYLMASPANKKSLLDAIEQAKHGDFVTKTMDELEAMAGE